MRVYNRFCTATAAIVFGLLAAQGDSPRPPYASERPLPQPVVFAEGTISTGDFESHPEFTPDGNTLYFVKSDPAFSFWTIYISRWEGSRWSKPVVAPFSGKYRDADPFITRDGKQFFFISDRPVDGKQDRGMDVWVMQRNGNGWGEPKNLARRLTLPATSGTQRSRTVEPSISARTGPAGRAAPTCTAVESSVEGMARLRTSAKR
jgi:Tol biopolymer transport system component